VSVPGSVPESYKARTTPLSDSQRGTSNFPVVLIAAARERAEEALFGELLDGLSFATAAEFQAGLNKRIGDFYDNCHNFASYIGRPWRSVSQESPPVFQRTSCLANSAPVRFSAERTKRSVEHKPRWFQDFHWHRL